MDRWQIARGARAARLFLSRTKATRWHQPSLASLLIHPSYYTKTVTPRLVNVTSTLPRHSVSGSDYLGRGLSRARIVSGPRALFLKQALESSTRAKHRKNKYVYKESVLLSYEEPSTGGVRPTSSANRAGGPKGWDSVPIRMPTSTGARLQIVQYSHTCLL